MELEKLDRLIDELSSLGVETRAIVGSIVDEASLGGKRIEVLA